MSANTAQGNVAILVVSWDGYQDLWKPFFRCFFKCWADCPYPIFLGSNSLTYPDERVVGISVGSDKDYSSNLMAMLSQIEQEWVLIWVEDLFLSAPVDTRRIQGFVAFTQGENAGCLQLLSKPFNPNSVVLEHHRLSKEIRVMPVGIPYRASINLGLWNKSVLLGLLRSGETAWDFEHSGTLRSFDLESRFLSISQQVGNPPFQFVHGVIKGRWTWEATRFIRRQGLVDCLGARSVQSYWSHLYMNCYIQLRHKIFVFVFYLKGTPGMLRLAFRRTWQCNRMRKNRWP